MTFWDIFWDTVPLAIMFGAGLAVGITITSMAAAGSRESRAKEEEEKQKTEGTEEIRHDFKGCWGCEFCEKINPEENRCEKTGRIFEDRLECSELRLKDCPINEGGKENKSNGDCDNDCDMRNAAGVGTDQQVKKIKQLLDERTEWECEA